MSASPRLSAPLFHNQRLGHLGADFRSPVQLMADKTQRGIKASCATILQIAQTRLGPDEFYPKVVAPICFRQGSKPPNPLQIADHFCCWLAAGDPQPKCRYGVLFGDGEFPVGGSHASLALEMTSVPGGSVCPDAAWSAPRLPGCKQLGWRIAHFTFSGFFSPSLASGSLLPPHELRDPVNCHHTLAPCVTGESWSENALRRIGVQWATP